MMRLRHPNVLGEGQACATALLAVEVVLLAAGVLHHMLMSEMLRFCCFACPNVRPSRC